MEDNPLSSSEEAKGLTTHIANHDIQNDNDKKQDEKNINDISIPNNENNIDKNEDVVLPPLAKSSSKDDGLIKTVRRPSVESIEDENNLNEKVEVIVPDRQSLLRMQFYSTPISLETTSNAFRGFCNELKTMGFSEQAEAALIYTNAESIEAAVEFIEGKGNEFSWHRFIPALPDQSSTIEITVKEEQKCANCNKIYKLHLLDESGNKISNNDIATTTEEIKKDDEKRDVEKKDNEKNSDEKKGDEKKGDEKKDDEKKDEKKDDEKKKDEEKKDEIAPTNGDKKTKTLEEFIQQRAKEISISVQPTTITVQPTNATTTTTTTTTTPPQEKKPDVPTQFCGVCLEDKPCDEFYKAPCEHNYCKTCLESHYRIKTSEADVLKVSCIDPKCGREIPEDEIKIFLKDKELLAKYEKFRKQKLLMLNPNARFCSRADCEGYMIGSRWNPKLTCPTCQLQICFNCNQPWHGYFVGCNQNVDMGYALWSLNKDVQKCPGCRVRIEKSDGCNHMTCRNCQYNFCWICRGEYTSNHFEPWNLFGCPGAQFTPKFCRCPAFFPRWFNRLLIIIFVLGVLIPLALVAGVFWAVVVCLLFCVRCDTKLEIDPCDCF